MSQQNFKEFSSDLYRNWYANEGACENCPNRDPCHYFTPKNIDPGWHSGSKDADVLIVGLEPSDEYPDGSNRESEQLGVGCESSTWDSGARASTFEDYYEGLNPDSPKEVHDGSVDIERMGGTIFEVLESYYYTNSKKCASTGDKDEKARKNCKRYLLKQINIIDPNVVVPLGEEAIRLFEDECNIPDEDTSLYEYVLTHYQYDGRTLIPAYHWSIEKPWGLPTEAKEKFGVDGIEGFYNILIEEIQSKV